MKFTKINHSDFKYTFLAEQLNDSYQLNQS